MQEKSLNLDQAAAIIDEIDDFRSWCAGLDKWSEPMGDAFDDPTPEHYGWLNLAANRCNMTINEMKNEWPAMYAGMFIHRTLGARFVASLGDSIAMQGKRPFDGQGRIIRTPTSIRKSVLVRDDCTCQFCGGDWPLPLSAYSKIEPPVSRSEDPQTFFMTKGPEVDHIIPATYGGPSAAWNLWTLCHRCNQRKGWDLWPPALRIACKRLEGGAHKSLPLPTDEYVPNRYAH